jgi:hypothetical protein
MDKSARPTLVRNKKLSDGVTLHIYKRDDKTEFYHRISPNGEHEFGGHNISSEDIQHVEESTSTTFDKMKVSVRVTKTVFRNGKTVFRNGRLVSVREPINPSIELPPSIMLPFHEFQQFESLKKSGMPHNQAIDYMAQQQSKPVWDNILKPREPRGRESSNSPFHKEFGDR